MSYMVKYAAGDRRRQAFAHLNVEEMQALHAMVSEPGLAMDLRIFTLENSWNGQAYPDAETRNEWRRAYNHMMELDMGRFR